jgi:hypothetical protein
LTRLEPSHSIHVAVVRFVARFVGGVGADVDDPIAGDAESSADWGYMIDLSWTLLGFGWILVLVVIGVPLQLLFGHGVGNIVLCIVMGAGFFCVAGSAAAIWRRYVYVPRARRLANSGWPDRSEEALRRSLPPNSSVVFQAAVGILAVVITAANL